MRTERRGHCPNRALIASTADVCEQAASKDSLLLLTLQRALHFISAKFQTLQHLAAQLSSLATSVYTAHTFKFYEHSFSRRGQAPADSSSD